MTPWRIARVFLVAGIVALASCQQVIRPATLTSDGTLVDPGTEAASFKDAFMKSFELEQHGGIVDRGLRTLLPVPRTAKARATWPANSEPVSFATQPTGSIDDYPDPGMTTEYTLALAPDVGDNVYLVAVTTHYPPESIMDHYLESYYVKDVTSAVDDTPDDTWDDTDPIVDATGAVDQTARVAQEIHFDDESVRSEKIVKLIYQSSEEDGFAPFDVTGPLTFPEFSYPAADSEAAYSSIVVYTHTFPTTHDFSFWQGVEQEDVIGVRYYTEHYVNGRTQYVGTLVAYEKAISTFTTEGGTFVDTLQDVFIGSEHTVLAESVLRKEVFFDVGADEVTIDPSAVAQNSIMRSHVVDITDQVDFQLQILNEDETRLLAWEGATYAIPEPGADGIEIANPDAAVLRKTEATNPDGSPVPLVTEGPGTGDLATLYTSIQNEAATQAIGTDVSGTTLDPDGALLTFDGHTGASYDDTANATTAGTVEAWIFITAYTNWGGIVHKGKKLDFSDEAWSLQYVSNRGDVAFAIVRQVPSYSYILAQSTLRLSTGRWYYLVGTWDASTVKIYVDGQQKGSVSNTLGAAATTDGPIVVGSQLLEGSTMQDWYGYNGRINAVKVSATAKSATAIAADYATGLTLTAGW